MDHPALPGRARREIDLLVLRLALRIAAAAAFGDVFRAAAPLGAHGLAREARRTEPPCRALSGTCARTADPKALLCLRGALSRTDRSETGALSPPCPPWR